MKGRNTCEDLISLVKIVTFNGKTEDLTMKRVK